jgi:menaquinone reductase, multiheme cytochrome c subunit
MSRFIFPEWTETLKKWVNLLVLGAPVYLVALIAYGVTPEALRIGYQPDQPVPYSHALHAGELGIDCRYCHSVVERSPKAAVPPAAVCMNCHSTVRKDSDALLPIRQAYANEEAVRWTRVTDLPDYVFFNHQAHVNAAVGCESCHGRIDQMVKVYQAKPLTMQWCIDCHKNPTPNLRDPANVTKMGYTPPPGEGRRVAEKNQIMVTNQDGQRVPGAPINCSTCHR